MGRLSNVDLHLALSMVEGGLSYRQVAERMGCSHTTIARLVERHNATGSVDDRQRPGRERDTTRQQNRYIVLSHLRDRFRTSVETAQETVGTHNLRVSALNVRRRLQKCGISSHKTYKGNVWRRNVEWVALISVESVSDGHNSVGVVNCSRTSPVFVLKCLIGGVRYGAVLGSDFKTVC